MNTILLCGLGGEARRFWNALSFYGEVFRMGNREKRICQTELLARGTPFCVWANSTLPVEQPSSGILLLGRELRLGKAAPKNGTVAVFESDNQRAVELLRASQCNAISCGTSPQDTVSVSSCSEQRFSVSVQRELQTLSGKTVEQGEITLLAETPCSPFFAAAFVAVLLLCDREGPLFRVRNGELKPNKLRISKNQTEER